MPVLGRAHAGPAPWSQIGAARQTRASALFSLPIACDLNAPAAWLVAARAKDRLPSEDASSSSPLFLLTGAAVALLLFLFTLPSRPPFAAGGQLGVGVLLGALSAALVAWGAGRRAGAAS